jgi:hypothetical protein
VTGVWAYLVAGALGGLVGVGELLTRYRDDSVQTMAAPGAWLYVLLNAGASAGALYLFRVFDWDLGQPPGDKRDAMQVLVASFSALAFFRSALFIVKIGDEDIPAGPSLLLTNLLGVADRSVDRRQAERRNRDVARVMQGIDFEKAASALPLLSLAASATTTDEESKKLAAGVDDIRKATATPPHAKSLLLGMAITGLLGVEVLDSSIRALGDEIRADEPDPHARDPEE